MNIIEWKGSPHYTKGVRQNPSVHQEAQSSSDLCRRDLDRHGAPPLIVLHTMAGSLAGTLAHFQNPSSNVSSHYGIGKKGEIHQYVKETDGAWTNGRVIKPTSNQIIQRRGNPNRYSITIEYEGKDYGGTIIEPQYQAGLFLIRDIALRWNIPLTREYIIGHYEIDSVNKINCPGPFFPWSRLMKELVHPQTLVTISHHGTPIALGYLDVGTTYAPIRKVAEALGFTVKWDELNHIVDLKR